MRARNVVTNIRGSTVDSTDIMVLAPLASSIALSRHECHRDTILIRAAIDSVPCVLVTLDSCKSVAFVISKVQRRLRATL